jgi:hypothetical protein
LPVPVAAGVAAALASAAASAAFSPAATALDTAASVEVSSSLALASGTGVSVPAIAWSAGVSTLFASASLEASFELPQADKVIAASEAKAAKAIFLMANPFRVRPEAANPLFRQVKTSCRASSCNKLLPSWPSRGLSLSLTLFG